MITRLLAFVINRFGREKGQAVVLFAAGGIAFMGMMAMVVDVGNLYFERRHAQATADAAALVAAQNAQGMMPNVTLKANDAVKDARIYAAKNGYQTDPAAASGIWHGEVRVDCPPSTGPNAGKPDHIEVQIKRSVNSFFAGIFNATLEARARAVARAKQSSLQAATISLNEGSSSTYNGGSGTSLVIGSTYSRGVTKSQSGSLIIDGKAYARGGFDGTAMTPSEGFVGPPYSAPPPDLFDPKWTAPTASSSPGTSWDSQGAAEQGTKDGDGWLHIQPGTYTYVKIASGAKVIFEPGVYRITQAQGLTNNGSIRGENVCFVMNSKADFSSQSQGQVYLTSSPSYNNILIWSADCSNDAVKLTGGQDVTFWGTIYAPCGTVRLSGNSVGMVHGQVVAYNIYFEGGSGTSVVYDPNRAADVPGPALVE
ncbi:MAG: pilus assembly protein TadG-related protein [Chloroflexota bacterium]